MNDFSAEFDHLKHLHLVAQNRRHMIEIHRGTWTVFEPTRFIYIYFTFNMLFNVNWEESIKQSIVTRHEGVRERDQIETLISFMFSQLSPEAISMEFLDKPGSRGVINQLQVELCQKISRDRKGATGRMQPKDKDRFIEILQDVLNQRRVGKSNLKGIIHFIYSVRCNIFHGSKTFEQMMSEQQRKRLNFYADILATTNELLIKSVEHAIDQSN